MALPNTNISTTLVADTIGSGSNDVGTLCTHPNVNKWSKWKPVTSNKHTGMTAEDMAATQFGLSIPFFSNRADLISFYTSTPAGTWPYAKPTGGASSPYRLGDFRNYEHGASRFYNVMIPNQEIGTGGVTVQLVPAFNSGGITWSDFSGIDLNLLHFCATGSNGNTVIESDPLITDNVGYVFLPTASSLTVYAFLGLVSPINPNQITRYYALEEGVKNVTYLQSSINVTMTNNLSLSLNRLIAQLRLDNTASGSSIQLISVSIQVRYGDKNPSDQLEIGEGTYSFGDITVVNGTVETRSNTFTNVLEDYSTRGGYVYFSCTSHPQLNQIFGINALQ